MLVNDAAISNTGVQPDTSFEEYVKLEELWSAWALKGFVEAFPVIETSEESD